MASSLDCHILGGSRNNSRAVDESVDYSPPDVAGAQRILGSGISSNNSRAHSAVANEIGPRNYYLALKPSVAIIK